MKKILSRLTLVMVISMVLVGMTPVAASAKTIKLKPREFTTKTRVAQKKSKVVKKGTTTLTISRSEGYIKFTAPKTKTYNFTFSDFKVKGTSLSFIYAYKKNKNDPTSLKHVMVSTKGGKTDVLRIASTKNEETASGRLADRYLHKRSVKMKLKKGETVYFYFYGALAKKSTVKLNIK